MRSRCAIALVSVASAVASCAGDGARDVGPLTRQAVRGRVVATDGCYADSMPVALANATVVDRTRTAFDGSFTVTATSVGPHRLIVGTESDPLAEVAIEVPAGVGTIERRIGLELRDVVRVTGMLLDTEGRKLPLSSVARLLPDSVGHDPRRAAPGADGVVEYFPFTEGSRLVARFDHNGRLAGGNPVAVVDAPSGRFEIEVPAGVPGRLVLEFRGAELAWIPLPSDTDLVEFFVDTAAAFGSLGTLALSVAEGQSGVALDRLVVLRHDASSVVSESNAAEFFRVDTPVLPLRLIGIPAGRYTAILESKEGTIARHEADVRGDVTASATLELREPASAALSIEDRRSVAARTALPAIAEACELRTLDGLPLPATFEGNAADGTLRVRGAPRGRAVLFAGSGHVVLDLETGLESTATLVLHDLVASEMRVRLFDGWSWKLPAAIPARLRILAADDVLVSDSRIEIEHSADGWTTVALETPPGDFRILFDAGDLRRVDETVRAGFVTVLR